MDERDALAIRDMRAWDPLSGEQERVPLFGNPYTGRELTHERSSRELISFLRIASLVQLASGGHSLGLGGATDYTNALSGGEMIAGSMGALRSEVRPWYMWACAARLDMVLVEVARQEEVGVRERW